MRQTEMDYRAMVRSEEMDDAAAWLKDMLAAVTAKQGRARPAKDDAANPAAAPAMGFGFTYAGKASADFLGRWPVRRQSRPPQDGFRLHRVVRTDPKTGLSVICEIKAYTDFPVLEWGLRLKNTSKRATPIIENVHSLDIAPKIGPLPYLHHYTGDYCVADGYEPFRVSLAHGEEYRFAPLGGRPTNRARRRKRRSRSSTDTGRRASGWTTGRWTRVGIPAASAGRTGGP